MCEIGEDSLVLVDFSLKERVGTVFLEALMLVIKVALRGFPFSNPQEQESIPLGKMSSKSIQIGKEEFISDLYLCCQLLSKLIDES